MYRWGLLGNRTKSNRITRARCSCMMLSQNTPTLVYMYWMWIGCAASEGLAFNRSDRKIVGLDRN